MTHNTLLARLYPNLRFTNITNAPIQSEQAPDQKQGNILPSNESISQPSYYHQATRGRSEAVIALEARRNRSLSRTSGVRFAEPLLPKSPEKSVEPVKPLEERLPKPKAKPAKGAGKGRSNYKPQVSKEPDLKDKPKPIKTRGGMTKIYSDQLRHDQILDKIHRKTIKKAEEEIKEIQTVLEEHDDDAEKLEEKVRQMRKKISLINKAKYFSSNYRSKETGQPLYPPEFLNNIEKDETQVKVEEKVTTGDPPPEECNRTDADSEEESKDAGDVHE